MRKTVILFAALLLSMSAFAQLEVKKDSFKEVVGFVNINTDKMYDDNDKPYAVLKVKTENINDKQRRELLFQGDARTFIECEYKVGEVWVYMSYYASYIKISHPDFSSTEFHFPFDMEPKCGYELTLVNKTTSFNEGWGSLSISTKPEDGAKVLLNGRLMPQKTPYKNDMIPSGKYEITVSKDRFENTSKIVEINDGENKSIEIEMPYIYGNLSILSEPSEATVLIDGVDYGTTPLNLNKRIVVGSHELRLEKKGCATLTKQFMLDDVNMLTMNERLETGREIAILTDKKGDKIYVDGRYIGESPITSTITFGDHSIKAVRADNEALRTIIVTQVSNMAVYIEIIPKFAFSVKEHKYIYFAKGNLQYQASTNIWRFAEHHWDYVGSTLLYTDGKKINGMTGNVANGDNSKTSSYYDGWIDLFGWGTSGYNGKKPYMTSTDDKDYGDGENISNTNYDWGVYDKISNGENQIWRTPTDDEWDFVINLRKTKSGIRYAKARVNGVDGLILLPDDWDSSIYNLKSTNVGGSSFKGNIITKTDWINKFENNGAVFLPAAGYRHGERYIKTFDSCLEGRYWSSTCYKSWSTNHLAFYLHFHEGLLDAHGYYHRGCDRGQSVRLVRDAE